MEFNLHFGFPKWCIPFAPLFAFFITLYMVVGVLIKYVKSKLNYLTNFKICDIINIENEKGNE